MLRVHTTDLVLQGYLIPGSVMLRVHTTDLVLQGYLIPGSVMLRVHTLKYLPQAVPSSMLLPV
ncbi:hypothetical protein DPMN_129011 [Dreissena polymorpha]|uniref:Uncharacterized protein n=1 Tax=Dreissena polymorpha TaxID=45954 RepID=A0A9D4H2B9_DREPO|nr:hypothetical protein DPMN_129011 [Dreissena polymorpha]